VGVVGVVWVRGTAVPEHAATTDVTASIRTTDRIMA
jgi:hypothetical protein